MADTYEYHKQNDYPGERVAERKRVSERAEAANKRSDARVAEKARTEGLIADTRVARKGAMDDELMDSEIERSTARAVGVSRARNTADVIGLLILVILVAGLGWSYMAIRQQADEIDDLNVQIAKKVNTQTADDVQLSTANTQIQLYKDYLMLNSGNTELSTAKIELSDANKQLQLYKDYLLLGEQC